MKTQFNQFLQYPIWNMAFRPFYLLAAMYGAVCIVLWAVGYTGTRHLPVQFWHAHEMIWGYTGAVVVGFLLTAVATWTGQPAVRGGKLMLLVLLWLLARMSVFVDSVSGSLINQWAGTGFFLLAAIYMGISVFKSKNSRNYIAVCALGLFGVSHAVFHHHLDSTPFNPMAAHSVLMAGLILISGLIGLIGSRVIPFFTAKKLNIPQIQSPIWVVSAALVLPMLMSILLLSQMGLNLLGIFGILTGGLACVQTVRWFHKNVLPESMLWILFLGYLMNGLGLISFGFSYLYSNSYNTFTSIGIHLIAVGGIGLLTLGMMTRTALGHTARPIYPAPKGMTAAFVVMLVAMGFRILAAIMMSINTTAYTHSYRLSAVLFAVALLMYVWRYFPYLTQARLDGKLG